uniref:Voltage-dependent calcium channel subunit alpha-2/delta-4-like n=1 Tax=Salmo trutta TaxID=8032 RepID=A0A673Z092_SALTR
IIKIVDIDGRDQVRDFAEDMERMLGSKMKSVKVSTEFDYYNSMLVNTADEDGNFIELGGEFPLEKNEHFNNLPVNTMQSDVQVPTNVYNKDAYILNGIYWSEALNDVFMNNFQKDPTLTWQYFGSSSGFFRIYPGIKWTPDSNGVAAFDCRNRNWYIQAATSPKDIIIVVDISGSMKGLKMTIAKHTINTILDTLGENDFVNVIAYTDYVRYVEPCFKGTLVQADLDNREHFKVLVDELHVKGEGKVAKAMKESFKILNEGQGSLCNQAIMLITDGAMEDFKDVFEEFNWPDRRVRLFTYLIGREMTFADNTKWIACNNKGYYTHISTLADVQENVMEYLHVLSRPMVINHNHDIIWTEAYMDTVAQSLLLMTTVAMPVFSKKKETLSHGILLGVVGSDIPLLEVMKLAPRYRLGPHGYAFLITNNGYILAHPDLRPLYKEGKTLKPKPNYNSVDLAEVEWEDIDETVSSIVKRPLFLTNDYFYTTINDTPFSIRQFTLGTLFIRNQKYCPLYLKKLNGPSWSENPIVFPFRTYCETDIDPHHRKYSQLQAVIRYLQGKEPDLECDEVLLQQTLFDAVVTAPLESYWQAIMLNASGMEVGVETAFLGTRSGLIRLTRYTGIETRVAKKFLTPADKDNLFTVDHFPLWYRLAMENPPGRFVYYIPVEDKDNRDKTGTIPIIPSLVPDQFELSWQCLLVSLYDYQGMCRSGHSHSSSARPLLSVSHVFQYFLTMKKALFAETFAMCSHKAKRTDALQPCDTEYPGFMLDNSIKETNSLLKCGRCQKMFVVQAVPDSNLVLMVVQADCDCSRQYSSITLEPKEVKYNASVKCNRMKSQKVRRRPKSCHAYHPKENAKDCGGASEISLSVALFLASLATSLALRRWT